MIGAGLHQGSVFAERFRVERALATGGMGKVYVVTCLNTGLRRALKVLNAEGCFDAEIRERFVKEARSTPSDASDHIVQVIDADVTDGRPWILTEFLDGHTLRERIERGGPMSPRELVEVMAQICHGLAAAHARGIVHRDLKPDNVMLLRANNARGGTMVKLLDFGVAKCLDPIRARGTASIALGTQGWWAPEQVYGGAITPATDVWSLGLLAYWCLTGTEYNTSAFPHESMLVAASERAVRDGVGARVPAGLDGWFARCVAWESGRRHPDVNTAFAALEASLTSSTPFAPTPPAAATHRTFDAQSVSAPPRGGRAGSALVVVCCFALACGLIAWASMSATPSATPSTVTTASGLAAGASAALDARPELRRWLDGWSAALLNDADVGRYYADRVRFRGSGDVLRTRAGVAAYWHLFFHGYRATIRFDWSRATVQTEPLDPARPVHQACAAMSATTPGVTVVRLRAVEDNLQNGVQTTDGSLCSHIEGEYILRLRDTGAGEYAICHDSWSLNDAICTSCPTARECVARSR